MAAESLPERIRKVAGPEALQGLAGFDHENPLHIDQVALHLVRHLRERDDMQAFELLVDVTQDELSKAARKIARDVGLVKDSDDLVAAYFSRLLTDLRRSRPETRHFLQEASERMRDEAEAWVRDYACMELPALGKANPGGDPSQAYATIVKICYHRLDSEYRQLLRAGDVEQMTPEDMSRLFALPLEQVRARLLEARARLAQAIAEATGRNPP